MQFPLVNRAVHIGRIVVLVLNLVAIGIELLVSCSNVLDKWFIRVIVITCVLNLLILITGFLFGLPKGCQRYMQIAYNFLVAVLLFAAGAFYIFITYLGWEFFFAFNPEAACLSGKNEKLAATIIILIQGCGQIVLAILLFKKQKTPIVITSSLQENGPLETIKLDYSEATKE